MLAFTLSHNPACALSLVWYASKFSRNRSNGPESTGTSMTALFAIGLSSQQAQALKEVAFAEMPRTLVPEATNPPERGGKALAGDPG
jgi:hypothetical protein